MALLETFVFPPKRHDLSAPYRPSIFLCCILIFWTGIAAISEVILPIFAFIGALTVYGPTIHFALRSIIRTSRGTHTSPEDVRSTSWWAQALTCIWIVYLAFHYYCYTQERSGWADIFLLPIFPASQALPILLYIAVRFVLDVRTRKSGGRVELLVDEESTAPPPSDALVAVSSRDADIVDTEDRPVETASSTVAALYHPSLYLLLISTLLTISIILLTILNIFQLGAANLILPIILSIEGYIPTLLLQFYLIRRITRGQEQTLGDAHAIASFLFELAVIWLSSRAMIMWSYPVSSFHVILGAVETLLVLYFAVRYAICVFREGKRQRGLYIGEDQFPASSSTPSVHEETGRPNDAVHSNSTYYHPSIVVLVVCIILSVLCICIEAPKEPSVGAPMSIIVYGPTIFIYVYFLVQRFKGTYADANKVTSATEWSIQLALIWVSTQAFYILIWPVSQYLEPHVMNPYVRWSAVALVVYIATRYVQEGRARRRSDGAIALPPDDSLPNSSDTSNTVAPSTTIPSI